MERKVISTSYSSAILKPYILQFVNVDNSMLVAVSVGWDMNSLIGGREDVTLEEKCEGDRERRLRLKVTRGGEVGREFLSLLLVNLGCSWITSLDIVHMYSRMQKFRHPSEAA